MQERWCADPVARLLVPCAVPVPQSPMRSRVAAWRRATRSSASLPPGRRARGAASGGAGRALSVALPMSLRSMDRPSLLRRPMAAVLAPPSPSRHDAVADRDDSKVRIALTWCARESRYLHAQHACQQNPHRAHENRTRDASSCRAVARATRSRIEGGIGGCARAHPPTMPQPRSESGFTGRCSTPVYQESGRMSRLSAPCSNTCAAQPVMREQTKIGVKSGMSKPIR